MNGKQWILLIVLADFVALTGWAVYDAGGFVEFYEMLFASSAGVLVFTDLAISLSLFTVWMVIDARKRGAAFWPYIPIVLAVGSVGPLLYLFVREAALRRTASEEGARSLGLAAR